MRNLDVVVGEGLQANLRDIVSSFPDHCNEKNITIKRVDFAFIYLKKCKRVDFAFIYKKKKMQHL